MGGDNQQSFTGPMPTELLCPFRSADQALPTVLCPLHSALKGGKGCDRQSIIGKGQSRMDSWQSPIGRGQWAEQTSPEIPHRMLHSLEAASCECLRLLEQPAAAVALGPAAPARAEGHFRSVLGQLQPFDQQGERLQDC